MVNIIIEKKVIQDKKQAIVKNNEKEKEFVNELKNRISCIDTMNILDCEILEEIT